jgi:hypothetical protein
MPNAQGVEGTHIRGLKEKGVGLYRVSTGGKRVSAGVQAQGAR